MRQEGHMRISIIGGGPAGLYFAILMQKADRQAEIDVYERNRADDTFGFGVVFSDESLDTFEAYDQESYQKLASTFAYWDDIEIHRKGDVQRIGGNGFCGCSRRELLLLMQERARSLGVRLHFETDVSLADLPPSDLIVAADGINSAVRQGFAEHFQPTVDLRPNQFAWMGSTRPLDAFSFFFEETEHGIFIAHAYQYEPGTHSTWIFECQPDTFERAGFGELDEAQSAARWKLCSPRRCEGHPLIINRSMWRNFPMIRTALGEGQYRADGRRQGDGAFLHRLGHQARHRRCHRAVRELPENST
jgi:anthraniloyl-CoA monooxygenase